MCGVDGTGDSDIEPTVGKGVGVGQSAGALRAHVAGLGTCPEPKERGERARKAKVSLTRHRDHLTYPAWGADSGVF